MRRSTVALLFGIGWGVVASAGEIPPALRLDAHGAIGRYSDGTISVALLVDRDAARIISFTRKARPFERSLETAASLPEERDHLKIALLGPGDARYSQRIPIEGICFEHGPDAPAHVEGDTIRLHRESYIVELPEIAGFDRVEIARETAVGGLAGAVPLGVLSLSADRFTAAGGRGRYEDLAFASPAAPVKAPGAALPASTLTAGTVHWPEEYGDMVRFEVWGDEEEAHRRINLVIVPDGYTYAEKATMLAHAQALVATFRARTPYAEHDSFLNYILVYAYSTQNDTDQCDCSIVRDTAMATRFPLLTPSCGSSDNRCLFYGNGNGGPNCDPNVSTTNIVAAELGAPARDISVIMVNTTRYGGCGGARAVYSAGNGAATEVALHEVGHSFAGLADEYAYTLGCGASAGNVNTSPNASTGAWPEWIPDLGAPEEGAQYYTNCLYRPEPDCEMRALGLPFCRVCRQQFALRFFGHFRIVQTAPLAGVSPGFGQMLQVGQGLTFGVTTRFASGPGVTNDFEWRLQGPGFPVPTTVSSGAPTYMRSFSLPGSYSLTVDVVGDTNFVKPARYGANRDVAGWFIDVTPVPEVSDDPIHQLMLTRNGANVDLAFEDVGSTRYNLYVSTAPGTLPFAVASPSSGKAVCGLAGVAPAGPGLVGVTNYDLGAGITGGTERLFVLVTADNGPGTEGSLGATSEGAARTADAACNP